METNLCMMTKGSKELLSCNQAEHNMTYMNLIPECNSETWCNYGKACLSNIPS